MSLRVAALALLLATAFVLAFVHDGVADAGLYRGDTEVTPTCREMAEQVTYLAETMVEAKRHGAAKGCVDGREDKCYAELYVYGQSERLAQHLVRMMQEQCVTA